METRELGAAFNALYHQWWKRAKPGYYAYRSSMGKRRAVLYSARSYLTELRKLEAEIPAWSDAQGVPGKREQEMWRLAARVRRAITNPDPDDVTALLPV